MEYRRLGKSELMVSELSFGGHQAGGYRGKFEMPLEERVKVIARGLELGITYFDTTSDPEPESLSSVFKLLGGKPEHITVTSMYTEYKHLDAIGDAAVIKEKVRSGIEECLTHFAPIDVFNLCGDGLPYSRERTLGALEAMEEARGQGKIAHFGFSTHMMDYALSMIQNHLEFTLIMFPYNVVLPKIAQMLFPVAAHHDVAVVGMKAMAARGLFNLGVEPVDYGPGLSVPVAAIKWVLQHSEVSCTIPAMNSIREVEENVRASGEELTEAEQRMLDALAAAFEHRARTDPRWYFHRDWTRRLYGEERVLAKV
jgi:aryl-alcohol dehydrogenase-like predicted oxidoreductase